MSRCRTASRPMLAAALALMVACDQDRHAVTSDGGSVSPTAGAPTAGSVVDSILPAAAALERFQAGLARPDTLAGPRSRDTLVSRFLRAVAARDVAALETLVVTRAEFAYLVFPGSAASKPPYRQPPDVAWTLLQLANGGALARLVNDAAVRFELLSYQCPHASVPDGDASIVAGCRVLVRESGVTREVRLFGRLVERAGRWKFLSLTGDL